MVSGVCRTTLLPSFRGAFQDADLVSGPGVEEEMAVCPRQQPSMPFPVLRLT